MVGFVEVHKYSATAQNCCNELKADILAVFLNPHETRAIIL